MSDSSSPMLFVTSGNVPPSQEPPKSGSTDFNTVLTTDSTGQPTGDFNVIPVGQTVEIPTTPVTEAFMPTQLMLLTVSEPAKEEPVVSKESKESQEPKPVKPESSSSIGAQLKKIATAIHSSLTGKTRSRVISAIKRLGVSLPKVTAPEKTLTDTKKRYVIVLQHNATGVRMRVVLRDRRTSSAGSPPRADHPGHWPSQRAAILCWEQQFPPFGYYKTLVREQGWSLLFEPYTPKTHNKLPLTGRGTRSHLVATPKATKKTAKPVLTRQ